MERWTIEQCVKTGMHPVRRGRRQVAWCRASEEEGEQTGAMAAKREGEETAWHTPSEEEGGEHRMARHATSEECRR